MYGLKTLYYLTSGKRTRGIVASNVVLSYLGGGKGLEECGLDRSRWLTGALAQKCWLYFYTEPGS